MKTDTLIELLETYSNAILGFTVLQSVAFAFTYGTNARFSCLVKNEPWLAPGLIAHFFLSSLLACVAIVFLGRAIRKILKLEQPASNILGIVYRAKSVAVILFAAIPLFTIGMYGMSSEKNPARCESRITS
jgi:hypothetical protein